MAKQYQLAFTLHGHSSDVRNLCVPNSKESVLLSASRDGSAIAWGPGSTSKDWDAKVRAEELERRFVSCVTAVTNGGQKYMVTGSSSGMMATYPLPPLESQDATLDAPTLEPQHTLIDHRQNLCCIDASANGLLVSGSWDKTAIVWRDFKKVVQIDSHQQAVWAVRFVGEDRVLTASADKTIVLHAIDIAAGKSRPLQKFSGHTDCVRGLSLTPDGKGFWSCGNDGLVNLYSFDNPSPLQSLSGHTSFVYSVSAFPDGSGAISSGEDGTLRVWSTTGLVQTIPHPSLSLWSTAIAPAPDSSSFYIISASADSSIRFFSNEEKLMAPEKDREAWDQEVAQRKLDKSQVGDVKRSDLPGMEALGRPGKKDGQVIMIKNNDNVEAYQWSEANTTWQQIGQVVDAIGSGRKQLYEGQEYDYVFDVDIQDGVPPLKLPYNVTENPWTAAQRFLEKNELPSGYAEQVVDFIQKNAGGVQLGTGGGDDNYADPLTGGSRYTGAPAGGAQSYGGDPYTGGGAYSTQPAGPAVRVLPVKTFLSFKKINPKAASGKVDEFNGAIKTASPELALDAEAKTSLKAVVDILTADKPASGEKWKPSKLLSTSVSWPEDKRFPLLDLLRAAALLSPALASTPSVALNLLQASGWGEAWNASKPRATNQLLAMRALANLFNTPQGRMTMAATAQAGLLTELCRGRKWDEVGTAKQPLATVALNYSILALDGSLKEGSSLLGLINHILDNETTDSETIYRAAVALGNLLSSPLKGSLPVGDVQNAKSLVAARAGALGEKRTTDLAAELASLAT